MWVPVSHCGLSTEALESWKGLPSPSPTPRAPAPKPHVGGEGQVMGQGTGLSGSTATWRVGLRPVPVQRMSERPLHSACG